MSRRGHRVAVGAGAVGVIVLVATGVALKDRLWEELWLYRLEHGGETAQKTAAERLGEMGSVRGVPRLLERMAEVAPRHCSRLRSVGVLLRGRQPPSWEKVNGLLHENLRRREAQEWALNWPGQALATMGEPAVPALLDVMQSSEIPSREADPWAAINSASPGVALCDWCRETLVHMGDAAVPALRGACEDPHRDGRQWIVEAITKIEEQTVADAPR